MKTLKANLMKYMVSIMLTAIMLQGITIVASAAYSGTPNTAWYNTTATEFNISTPEQLAGLATLVNGGNEFKNKTIRLTADIVWFDGVIKADGTYTGGTPQAWTPIGYGNIGFSGTFDGQGHTIKGLYYTDPEHASGLIGNLYSSGTVKNVGIIDSFFSGTSNIGSIAGKCYGNIDTCFSNAFIKARLGTTGGICGMFQGDNTQIKNCYFTGSVLPTVYSDAIQAGSMGGIIGKLQRGTFQNCYYLQGCAKDSSHITQGGIGAESVGQSTSDVSGRTIGTSSSEITGGSLAYLLNGNSSENPVWYQNLDNAQPVDAGPVLSSSHGTVYHGYEDCLATEMTYSNSPLSQTIVHRYINGICDFCGEYSEPVISGDFYQIENFGNLLWFGDYVNKTDQAANAILTHDIDMENREFNYVISNTFKGHFNGNGKAINNYKINATKHYAGLFTYVEGGTVENFTINGAITANTNDIKYIGSVASRAKHGAKISNITVNVNITGNTNATHIGGIVGSTNLLYDGSLTIENCIYNGTINLPNAEDCVGGIIGFANGNVVIKNCGSNGQITSLGNTGGIVGYINGSSTNVLSGCYSNTVVEGTYAGGIGGKIFVDSGATYINNVCNTGLKPYGYCSSYVKTLQVSDWTTGEATYYLNGGETTNPVWHQDLGDNGDALPSFAGGTVYRVGQTKYSNTPKPGVYIENTITFVAKQISEPCLMIVTNYNGNTLIDTKIIPITEDTTKTIGSASNTTKIRAMIWDRLGSMKPLCEYAEIDK